MDDLLVVRLLGKELDVQFLLVQQLMLELYDLSGGFVDDDLQDLRVADMYLIVYFFNFEEGHFGLVLILLNR